MQKIKTLEELLEAEQRGDRSATADLDRRVREMTLADRIALDTLASVVATRSK